MRVEPMPNILGGAAQVPPLWPYAVPPSSPGLMLCEQMILFTQLYSSCSSINLILTCPWKQNTLHFIGFSFISMCDNFLSTWLIHKTSLSSDKTSHTMSQKKMHIRNVYFRPKQMQIKLQKLIPYSSIKIITWIYKIHSIHEIYVYK